MIALKCKTYMHTYFTGQKYKIPKVIKLKLHELNIPLSALSLGLAGLIPFWGLTILIITLDSPMKNFAVQANITYGALILSFLGGIHWGVALMNAKYLNWLSLSWGVSPTLFAWLALFLQPSMGLTMLIFGFLATAIIDFRIFASNRDNAWFGKLRTILSIGAITALLLTLSFGSFSDFNSIWIL